MGDYNSYEEQQKIINDDSKASGSLLVLVFFIILSIALVALIVIWCSFKSVYFYINAAKTVERNEPNSEYFFQTGLQDLRKTYSKYWDFVSDYFIECCNSYGYYYYAIGILMYPIGLAYSLIFIIFHFFIMSIYIGFNAVFNSKTNRNKS